MKGGVPRRGGLPGQPGRVTRLASEGEFSPCESQRWGNPPNWGGVHPGIYQDGCQPLQAWRAFPTISSSKRREKQF